MIGVMNQIDDNIVNSYIPNILILGIHVSKECFKYLKLIWWGPIIMKWACNAEDCLYKILFIYNGWLLCSVPKPEPILGHLLPSVLDNLYPNTNPYWYLHEYKQTRKPVNYAYAPHKCWFFNVFAKKKVRDIILCTCVTLVNIVSSLLR